MDHKQGQLSFTADIVSTSLYTWLVPNGVSKSQAKYCETTDTKQYLPEHRVPKLQGVDPSLHVALDEEQ